MNQLTEELSFAPFHLKRPHSQPGYTKPKTISNKIHELLTFPSFLNILYSYSEVSYIRSTFPNPEITSDKVNQLVSQYNQSSPNHQQVLEELNSIIIKENSYKSVFDTFKSNKITEKVISWLQPSLQPNEKCLILNIISFCLQFSELSKKSLSNLWKSIFESASSTTQGSCVKKHILLLLQIVDIICNFETIEESTINYTCPQPPTLLASSQNPQIFPLLIYGEPPKSFETGEKILKETSLKDKAYLEYIETGEFSSETNNEDCRDFLMINGQSFNQFIQFINQHCFSSSRIFVPQSDFDVIYKPPNLNETVKFDNLRERDIIFFSTWAIIQVINALLNKSNFMDASVLHYYVSLRLGGKNLILSCLKLFLSDLKEIEKVGQISSEKLAYKEEKDNNSNPTILELAIGTALHVTTDLISESFRIMQQFVTDKDVKNIVKIAEASESYYIKSEAAYAVSKFSRWIPPQLKKKPNLQIINFLFLNLEEFELFEKFSKEGKPDVIPKCIGPNHIDKIKKHVANINLQITDIGA